MMSFFFDESKRPKVYVYTDGSYRDGVYAGAFLVCRGTQCIYQNCGCGTKAADIRNVAGELASVMRAAVWLKKNNYAGVIVHDYEGVSKWMTQEWKRKNSFVQDYYNFMLKYVKDGTVTFKWVKGHNGDLGNHLADKLARHALDTRKGWE